MKKRLVAIWALVGLAFLCNVKEIHALDRPVTLGGQAIGVKIVSEDIRSVQLEISLDLSFKNDSKTDVILYNSDFDIVDLVLFKTEPADNSTTTLYSLGSRASNFKSEELTDLQNRIASSTPSRDIAQIIVPGDTANVKKTTGLKLYKTKISGYKNATWDEILEASPVSLTIQVELFPQQLDTKSEATKSFGDELRIKWQQYGALQLDEVKSAPISLDLRTALLNKKNDKTNVADKNHSEKDNKGSNRNPEAKSVIISAKPSKVVADATGNKPKIH
jgi:hypothetical protein